jgi:hypothetical protein
METISNVLVLRKPSEPDWTLSRFFFDGKEKGVGVEDEKREVKVHGETCIPCDTYDMGLRNSPKFSHFFYRDDEGNLLEEKMRVTKENKAKYHTPHELVWVMNVPGFEFILWHWGNSDDDTHGCYIVGSIFGTITDQKGVLASKMKYKEIYPILWRSIKAGKVTVEYKEEINQNPIA